MSTGDIYGKSLKDSAGSVDLAYIDELTGLYNRRYLNVALIREVSKAREENKKLSLIMMDCDNLKDINDRYGHLNGDSVLIEIAAILKKEIGETGIVSRFAGDEFIVVLFGRESKEVLEIAGRLSRFISERKIELKSGRDYMGITISMGIAAYPDDADGASSLLDRADQTLYSAKRMGKNRISTISDLITEVQDRDLVANAFPCRKFVNRTKELEFLQKAYKDTGRGEKKLVCIEGEQGVGKTRLILELFNPGKIYPSFLIMCSKENIGKEYSAISDAFNGFLEPLEAKRVLDAVNSLDEVHKTAVTAYIDKIKVLPVYYSKDKISSPEKLSEGDIIAGFVNLIRRLNVNVVPILVDDIAWIDRGSLEVIKKLLDKDMPDSGVFIIGSISEDEMRVKDEQKTPFMQFLGEKHLQEITEAVELGPFTEDAVTEFIRVVFSGILIPKDIEKRMFEISQGIPFQLEGIIRRMFANKIVYAKGGRWILNEKEIKDMLTDREYAGAERRGYMRLHTDCPVDYVRLSDDLKPAYDVVEDSYSKNISASGIKFISSENLSIGSFLELHIKIPAADRYIAAIGKVLRCEAEGGGHFGVALSFIWISQKDKQLIDEYVKNRKLGIFNIGKTRKINGE